MSANRVLAAAAIISALAALMAGDFQRLDRIPQERAIDVYDVARRLRDREPLLLVDLRGDKAIEAFALPGAVDTDEGQVQAAMLPPEAPVIVYGFEDNRRWTDLPVDPSRLRFLADGVDRWLTDILDPVLFEDASPQARAEFAAREDLVRYFGGVPRISRTPPQARSSDDQLDELKRRGCGF